MAIYAISDLHLAKSVDKPMDIFGDNWEGYMDKIEKNWRKTIKDTDVVLIPGDISWATYIDESIADFKFIESLPGRKIISKGNHDYWWETVTKIKRFFDNNNIRSIDIIHNNAFEIDNCVIYGTRGWTLDTKNDEHSYKIVNREFERLKLSFSCIDSKDKKTVVMFHYPPFDFESYESIFTKLIEEKNIDICIYGHIHSFVEERKYDFIKKEVSYKLVSSDYLEFKPYRLI